MSDSNIKSWTEYFRILTPVFLFSLNIIAGMAISNQAQLKDSIDKLDIKIFSHLTNDDLHTPKSIAVTRLEWNVYQTMRDKQMSDIKDELCTIREMLEKRINGQVTYKPKYQ